MIFNMVGGAGGGTTEGMYCWAKSLKETSYPALTFTGVTFTPTGNAYNIVANSGDGWGQHIIHSAEINADSAEVEIVYVPNTLQATWFIGFAESAQTQYANITHSVMLESGQIKRYNGANLVGQIGTFAAGDTIRIKIANGTFSVYKADTLLNSSSISLSKLVLNATFYQGGKDYGTIEYYATASTEQGFVIDDEPNAYPNGGYWDDGYYYVKVGATKVTPAEIQYVEGTASHTASQSYSLTVSNLGFTPKVIYVSIASGSDVYSQTTQCMVQNINNAATVLMSYRNTTYANVPTFAITENGFTVTGNTPPAQYTMYCYANLTYKAWG